MSEKSKTVEQRLNEGDEQFAALKASIDRVNKSLDEMRADVTAVREIVGAWASIKGFVRTITVISEVASFLLKIAGVLGLVYLAGKLGDWRVLWGWLPKGG